MKNNFIDWIIEHGNNYFVVGAGTLLFPKLLQKQFFLPNCNKQVVWKQKSACLTISFDCDYPRDVEAIPQLLGVLAKYSFKTSFACVGHWIEKYPDEHKMIIDSGHEIMNHTYSHPDNELLNPGRKFKEIPRAEKKEEVQRCHDICRKILHYEPKGCRIPHFKNLFTSEIYGILKELQYDYSSSTTIMNTTCAGMPFKAECGIYEFPLSTCPKHPFTVFDTWHSFNSQRLFYKLIHRTEDQYIVLFKQLLELGINTNSYINVYIDPFDVLGMKHFDALLTFLQDKQSDVWVATYQQIMNKISEGGKN